MFTGLFSRLLRILQPRRAVEPTWAVRLVVSLPSNVGTNPTTRGQRKTKQHQCSSSFPRTKGPCDDAGVMGRTEVGCEGACDGVRETVGYRDVPSNT